MTTVLGVSAFYHDSAAALATEDGVVGAVQEERLTRIKGDSRFPRAAISQLLGLRDCHTEEIDAVAFYEKPGLKLQRILRTQISEAPYGWKQFFEVAKNFELSQFRLKGHLTALGLGNKRVLRFAHHESHAASAYYCSPFESAAVLTIDGVGEWSTSTISKGEGSNLVPAVGMHFPNSVGLLYATFTAYCGFKVNSGEYKLMGLAPFGQPIYVESLLDEIVDVFPDGSIALNLQYFGFTRSTAMYSDKLEGLLGFPPREPEGLIEKAHCDLAASIQVVLERIVEGMALHALNITGEENLCLAGGVALNCVANGRLTEQINPSKIFIQPAAGDAGGALGAACLGVRELMPNVDIKMAMGRNFALTGAFLGRKYSNQEVLDALTAEGLVWDVAETEESWAYAITERLIQGQVVGVFLERSEFGPRALGARSILADPRSDEMQTRLNLKIKRRESFRPFAPMVLADQVAEWFDWPRGQLSPYMLFTCLVKSELQEGSTGIFPSSGNLVDWVSQRRSPLPAVTHVDYSARIQTVAPGDPAHLILDSFFQATNVPVLVNTSFNVRGEPIVDSPIDAIKCFLATDMDCLVFDRIIVDKKRQPASLLRERSTPESDWELD